MIGFMSCSWFIMFAISSYDNSVMLDVKNYELCITYFGCAMFDLKLLCKLLSKTLF